MQYDVGLFRGALPEVHRLWADLAVPEFGESGLPYCGSSTSGGISALKPEWLLAEGCAEGGYLVSAEETDGDPWRHDGGTERRLGSRRACPGYGE